MRSVRSINTMAGTRSFAVAVVCDLEHHPQVIHALGSEVVETCYIYCKRSKENRKFGVSNYMYVIIILRGKYYYTMSS